MTDNRKRIPIPVDIQPGDVLVLRDGQRRQFKTWDEHGNARVHGRLPSALNSGGRWYAWRSNLDNKCHKWDVVAIGRKAKPKPVRDDNDAVWLAKLAKDGQTMQTETMQRRLMTIARRLNGGNEVKP